MDDLLFSIIKIPTLKMDLAIMLGLKFYHVKWWYTKKDYHNPIEFGLKNSKNKRGLKVSKYLDYHNPASYYASARTTRYYF